MHHPPSLLHPRDLLLNTHMQWFLSPPLEIELLILLSCSRQKGLESLTTVFLKFWARERESKHFLLLTVAAILRTKSQK